MSRTAREHARVVHFANTFQQLCRVDADDFEAAALLSNSVLRWTQKNATMPTTKQDTVVATQRAHCRRNSRLLHMFRIENHTPNAPSKNIAHNPPAKQVNLT